MLPKRGYRVQLAEIPESSACPESESILEEEIYAWSLYWTAIFDRTYPQPEIDRLKKGAQDQTTALREHMQGCSVCKKAKAATWWSTD